MGILSFRARDEPYAINYDAVLSAIGPRPPAQHLKQGWTLRDGFRRILGRPLP